MFFKPALEKILKKIDYKEEIINTRTRKTIQQHELDIEEISASLKRANLRIIVIEEGIEVETK